MQSCCSFGKLILVKSLPNFDKNHQGVFLMQIIVFLRKLDSANHIGSPNLLMTEVIPIKKFWKTVLVHSIYEFEKGKITLGYSWSHLGWWFISNCDLVQFLHLFYLHLFLSR